MPNSGSADMAAEYAQPNAIITDAARMLILLFRLIACVIANHRSSVIMVNVNTDRWLANTVRKPAALQPKPDGIGVDIKQ